MTWSDGRAEDPRANRPGFRIDRLISNIHDLWPAAFPVEIEGTTANDGFPFVTLLSVPMANGILGPTFVHALPRLGVWEAERWATGARSINYRAHVLGGSVLDLDAPNWFLNVILVDMTDRLLAIHNLWDADGVRYSDKSTSERDGYRELCARARSLSEKLRTDWDIATREPKTV